jgi:hypothetical protein
MPETVTDTARRIRARVMTAVVCTRAEHGAESAPYHVTVIPDGDDCRLLVDGRASMPARLMEEALATEDERLIREYDRRAERAARTWMETLLRQIRAEGLWVQEQDEHETPLDGLMADDYVLVQMPTA